MSRNNQPIVNFKLLLLLAILLVGGCLSSTTIDLQRDNYARVIAEGESIAILGRRHNIGPETEGDFIDCLGKSLEKDMAGVNIIPEQQFINSLYPYFEPSTAPMNVQNLDDLVRTPGVAKKLEQFRVRYIIWIEGSTERTDSGGSLSCTISPAGGGCFGFATWDDQANYRASVWDLEALQSEGTISSSTSGTSYMPAILIPIPILARVQATACEQLSEQIKEFLG